MIAGKCIDAFALGAISATSSFNVLINAMFIGIAEGFTIYVSQLFGKGNFVSIKRGIVSMTWFVGALSVLVSVLVIVLCDPILNYLNVDPLLREEAKRYFIIYALGYAVFFVNMFWVRTLYALGITSFSLYISVLSAVLNVGGNLLTVLVFDLGVAGLAISTLFSSLAASVCYIMMLRRAFHEMPTENLSYRFSISLVRRTLRFSMPVAIQKMAFLGISFVIAPAINALGAAATTGYGVANQLYNIGTMTIWAATSAFSCYTAQCVGEGDTKKIRRGVRVGLEINGALLLPVVLGISVLADYTTINYGYPHEDFAKYYW
jgi:Na+-driven multidrug efflux pump